MKRVLLVAASYAPNLGGLQTVTAQLARGLVARGVAVQVITSRYPRRLPASETLDGVLVRRMDFVLPRGRDLRRGRFDLFAAGIVLAPFTTLRLVVQILRFRPSAVNLHFVGAPAFFVLLAHSLLRFRLVVSLHGDDVEGLAGRSGFDRWVFRTLLRRAEGVTAVSRALLAEALAIAPTAAARARVIYNSLNGGEVPCEGGGGEDWVAVGRLVPKKGFDVLIEAFARAQLRCGALVLIGDGPERARLEELSRARGLERRILFRGALPHPETLRIIACGRGLIVPSRAEPFGLVALEAMAAGKPVLASAVGGLPEVLDGAEAVLVPPDDVPALAAGLEALDRRLEREPTFGARNRQCAARFSQNRLIESYLEVL